MLLKEFTLTPFIFIVFTKDIPITNNTLIGTYADDTVKLLSTTLSSLN